MNTSRTWEIPRAGWKWTREDVIRSIDAGTNTFFVLDPYNGKRSECRGHSPGRASSLRSDTR